MPSLGSSNGSSGVVAPLAASEDASQQPQQQQSEPEEHNMLVLVRTRPLNDRERQTSQREIVRVVPPNLISFDPPSDDGVPAFSTGAYTSTTNGPAASASAAPNAAVTAGSVVMGRKPRDLTFPFDRVFGPHATQEEVFAPLLPLISNVLDGMNATVCAYGATSAGKTHTMVGTEDAPGIMILAIRELYRRAELVASDRLATIAISYLEVYNETIRDLIQPSGPLALREENGTVTIAGLSVHTPSSPDELFGMLTEANANRTQHPTDANANSSRSHAVLQVHVRQSNRTASIHADFTMAKLTLIDLAGSERATVTTNSGARLREGANINRSLLALGNCINALVERSRRRSNTTPYIPFRDSKLTRLLKDSLGGNCKTVMIANVSPAPLCMEDTHNTLVYASRARSIKSTVVANETKVEFHVSRYVTIIDDLQNEVAELKAKLRAQESRANAAAKTVAQPPSVTVASGYPSPLVRRLVSLAATQQALLAASGRNTAESESLFSQAMSEWQHAQRPSSSASSASSTSSASSASTFESPIITRSAAAMQGLKRTSPSTAEEDAAASVRPLVQRLRATFEEASNNSTTTTPIKLPSTLSPRGGRAASPSLILQQLSSARAADGTPAVARYAPASVLDSLRKQKPSEFSATPVKGASPKMSGARARARVSFAPQVIEHSDPNMSYMSDHDDEPALPAFANANDSVCCRGVGRGDNPGRLWRAATCPLMSTQLLPALWASRCSLPSRMSMPMSTPTRGGSERRDASSWHIDNIRPGPSSANSDVSMMDTTLDMSHLQSAAAAAATTAASTTNSAAWAASRVPVATATPRTAAALARRSIAGTGMFDGNGSVLGPSGKPTTLANGGASRIAKPPARTLTSTAAAAAVHQPQSTTMQPASRVATKVDSHGPSSPVLANSTANRLPGAQRTLKPMTATAARSGSSMVASAVASESRRASVSTTTATRRPWR
ncbi:kinesin-like protein KIF18B [Capsaspora owczarzaki ATCC 30864]|uniref:Kinesin-like protein n=2 Tax=Capsaspora owczarzaki (strain ATCC 30864) TaxID=595528 RepID=A0A0D2U6E2_CAPO3|nr:kinesin-like protein KIF18B [Capsaspora owczarzaki ATCC 30864]